MKKIDSHLHVWADDPSTYPYREGQAAPAARGNAEFLLELMDDAEVAGALIVQPIVHGFDHTYVGDTLAQWPDRFIGMCLVDPQHDDPVGMLDDLVERGYRGVRFNPALWRAGETMAGDVGRALYSRAGELSIAVGFLVSPENYDEIDALAGEFPNTAAIVDHFGHCVPSIEGFEVPEFERLISMSRHPNLHVKLSEFPRASNEEFPYADLFVWVHRLIDAYTADRLMWGTDFPFIVEQAGYSRGWEIADRIEPALGPGLAESLLGGTCENLFGVWGG
ncbi:MAG: amidohydrolase family protein [Chloroflexi bacterium]|nr:amidohydrolase family protein [Chloroflexota bacterium]